MRGGVGATYSLHSDKGTKFVFERGCIYYIWSPSKFYLYAEDGSKLVNGSGDEFSSSKYFVLLLPANYIKEGSKTIYKDLVGTTNALNVPKFENSDTPKDAPNIYAMNADQNILVWKVKI